MPLDGGTLSQVLQLFLEVIFDSQVLHRLLWMVDPRTLVRS